MLPSLSAGGATSIQCWLRENLSKLSENAPFVAQKLTPNALGCHTGAVLHDMLHLLACHQLAVHRPLWQVT